MPIKERGQHEPAEGFITPRNLFPEADRMRTKPFRRTLRRYVEDKMVAMATSGELYVTELLNQPDERTVQLIGEIILGIFWDDSVTPMIQQVRPDEVPDALSGYRVHLRAINGHKIEWKKGRRQAGERSFAWTGQGSKAVGKIQVKEDVFLTAGEDQEADVTLSQAWLALRQYGKNCRPEKKQSGQQRNWRFEEVPPIRKQVEETEPKGIKTVSRGSFKATSA